MQYHVQFLDVNNNRCGFTGFSESGEQEIINVCFDLFDAIEIIQIEKII